MSTEFASSSVLDTGRLASLKRQVKAGDAGAAKEVARQFESLFMQMVLKAMRDAVPREGLFDNNASRLYESLHDQQLSLQLGAGRGLGLAAMVERQISRDPMPATPPLGPLPLRREAPAFPLETATSGASREFALPGAQSPVREAGHHGIAVSPAPTLEGGARRARQPGQFARPQEDG